MEIKICIYCGKKEETVSFRGREHVIPELLGTFNNNLTLRCVCDYCNSTIFNKLEARFKEDTEEGVFCQMINFSESVEVRIRHYNNKFKAELGFKEKLFNEIFPFLVIKDGEWKVMFISQIKITGYGKEGYIILLLDKIKTLSRTGKKFKKIKNFIKGTPSKNVSVFIHEGDEVGRKELRDAVDLIKELGIDYKPGTEKSEPFVGDGSDNKKAGISMDFKIDADTTRVLSKIAFNYFAYCAIESGHVAILNHENFSKIKSYIIGKTDIPINEIIIEKPTRAPLLNEEIVSDTRLVAHIVTLHNENCNLVAKLTFAGRQVYKILLGKMPSEIDRKDFGNGHMFDPRTKEIFGLTQNEKRKGTDNKLNFSLFNNW